MKAETHIWSKKSKRCWQQESGFSLFAVLIAVVALGGVVSTAALYDSGQARVAQARAAGWHLVEISRAARLYVRNNAIATAAGVDGNGDGLADDALVKAVLDAAPQEILIADLIAAGLLPNGFSARNVLGQNARIFAANYPLGGDPALPTTAATAYVYLDPGPAPSAIMMQTLAQAARESGLPVLAPTLDAGGNPAEDCESDGLPDVALWDTGCLNNVQFTALTGVPFAAGALLVPAWRSMPHDPRAVMRYEQPENPEPARMVTNLALGRADLDSDGDCETPIMVSEPDANGVTYTEHSTGLCDVLPDQPGAIGVTETDRRVDILNVSAIAADRVVARPQGPAEVTRVVDPVTGALSFDVDGDDLGSGLSTDIDGTHLEVLSIGGSTLTRAVRSTGNIAALDYAVQLMKADGVTPGDLTVSENIFARRLSLNDMATVVARGNFFSQGLKVDGMDSLEGVSDIGVMNNLSVEGDSIFDEGVTIQAGSVNTSDTISVTNASIDTIQTGALVGTSFESSEFIVTSTGVPSGPDPGDWVDPARIHHVNTVEIGEADFYSPETLNLDWNACQGECPDIYTIEP